jgi:hypothetical protein
MPRLASSGMSDIGRMGQPGCPGLSATKASRSVPIAIVRFVPVHLGSPFWQGERRS